MTATATVTLIAEPVLYDGAAIVKIDGREIEATFTRTRENKLWIWNEERGETELEESGAHLISLNTGYTHFSIPTIEPGETADLSKKDAGRIRRAIATAESTARLEPIARRVAKSYRKNCPSSKATDISDLSPEDVVIVAAFNAYRVGVVEKVGRENVTVAYVTANETDRPLMRKTSPTVWKI